MNDGVESNSKQTRKMRLRHQRWTFNAGKAFLNEASVSVGNASRTVEYDLLALILLLAKLLDLDPIPNGIDAMFELEELYRSIPELSVFKFHSMLGERLSDIESRLTCSATPIDDKAARSFTEGLKEAYTRIDKIAEEFKELRSKMSPRGDGKSSEVDNPVSTLQQWSFNS
ncbi:MAG: hypothetical protein Q9172_006781 [Xanthocarpia lactea]